MPPNQQSPESEHSLGELLGSLVKETQTLVRQEISLAKSELSDKAAEAARSVASVALGGMVAYTGFLAIVAGVILLLIHEGVSAWVSALVVGVVIGLIGGIMAVSAIKAFKSINPVPTQTAQTVKEDIQWTREQLK